MQTPAQIDTVRNWLLGIIAVVLLGFALRMMQPVLVPVTLALFIALVVSPVERRIAEIVPDRLRWLGLAAAMAVILSIFSVFVAVLWIGTRRIAGALSGVPRRIDQLLSQSDLRETLVFGTDLEQLISMLGERGVNWASGMASRFLNQASTTLVMMAITLFLVLLMLAEAPRWMAKLRSVSEEEETSRWKQAIRLIARKLRLYLLARAGMGLLTSVCYVGWLWYCGLDLLSVWGLLTFLFSFVPNLGSVLSAVLPVLYALLTRDTGSVWLVAIGLLVIEQVIGNLVDPRVQGRQVSLSPLVILLSVLFWGWIWGAPGALLGVPVMIAVVVAAANIAPARPLALMLSDQTDMEGLDRVALDYSSLSPEPPRTAPASPRADRR